MDDEKLFDDDVPQDDAQNGKAPPPDDGGLSNLPPLSDAASQGGFDSDVDLPPLDDYKTEDLAVTEDNTLSAGQSEESPGETLSDADASVFSSEPSGETIPEPEDALSQTPSETRLPSETPTFDTAFGEEESLADADQTAAPADETREVGATEESPGETLGDADASVFSSEPSVETIPEPEDALSQTPSETRVPSETPTFDSAFGAEASQAEAPSDTPELSDTPTFDTAFGAEESLADADQTAMTADETREVGATEELKDTMPGEPDASLFASEVPDEVISQTEAGGEQPPEMDAGLLPEISDSGKSSRETPDTPIFDSVMDSADATLGVEETSMVDKEAQDGKEPFDGDSGLGNLPPLSEFDSQGGFDSDGDLPPLGDFETQDGGITGGGATIPADEPADMAVDSSFPGDDSLAFASEPPGETISQPQSSGFQDLAADSDFSPETPDIGPGPDSTLDTPIFDSAFGGDDSGFGPDQTSTATQAMESPMFDDFGGDTDFGTTPDGATPMPDFSPDTGFGDMAGVGAGAAPAPAAGPSGDVPAAGRRGVSPWVVIIFGIIALGIGVVTSPFLADYLAFLPNPLLQEIQQRDSRIADLQSQISRLQQLQATEDRPVEISEARVAELQNEILARSQELDAVTGQLESTRATLDTQQRELNAVERDLRERNDEIIAAREFLEELRNETAIVQARQRGLISEVDRLTGYVGELEEANARRLATKEALEHNIDRLVIQIKESIPLTPQKFDHAQRLADAKALREKAAQVSWVTPELQNEYTSFYLRELEISQANEYFFARVPVTDRFGHRAYQWAECLMRGNWAVYYRTLEGKNVGSFENTGATETPLWGFREDLPADVQKSIESYIMSARVPDFESQVQLLAERELAGQEGTVWQRVYSSL